MNRLEPRSLAGAVLLIASLAASSATADLTGKWHISRVGLLDRFVDIVQTGSALTFTFTSNGQPVPPFIGTLNGADYDVLANPLCAELLGSVFPSGNTFDGDLIVGAPPTCDPLGGAEFVATRCTCFDGNTTDGDGCSGDCQVEPCFICAGNPSICTPSGDGAACDGHVCTIGETCSMGACGGGSPVVPCVDMTGAWHFHTVGTDFYNDPIVNDANRTIQQRGTDLIFTDGNGAPISAGTIEPATGAFTVRTANQCIGSLPFDFLTGAVASGGDSFSATGLLGVPDLFYCVTAETFVVTGTRSTCGNAVIESGETCDDGNQVAGDGCDADCQVESCRVCSGTPSVCTLASSGSPCEGSNACIVKACDANGACVGSPVDCDDGHACTVDSCDPAVGCVHTPRAPVCRSARHSALAIRAAGNPVTDSLAWTWSRGASTIQPDFGDPRSTSAYTFCLVAGTSAAVVGEAVIAPDADHWTAVGSSGFAYRDRRGAADGIRRVRLIGSAADRTKIILQGRGTALSSAPFPLDVPIAAYLFNEDTSVCWSASYGSAEVTHNGPSKLQAEFTVP